MQKEQKNLRHTSKKEDKMSKKLLALFLVLGLMAYAEDTNTVASDTTTES